MLSHRVFVALLLALSPVLAAPRALADADTDKRLVVLPLTRGPGVSDTAYDSAFQTIAAEADAAASERGYETVPLRKVAGVEELAARCHDADCRRTIYDKLGVSHAIHGEIGRAGKRLRVQLFLERIEGAEFVGGATVEATAITLPTELRAATLSILEAGAPKEQVIRDRLVATATSYAKSGRAADAVRTYERAIALAPFHPESARLSLEIVRTWLAVDDHQAARAAARSSLEIYGPSSAWARARVGGQQLRDEVDGALAGAFFRLGVTAYRSTEAAGTPAQKAAAFRTAVEDFEVVLQKFPEADDFGEASLLYAEAAYATGDVRAAAHAFSAAAEKAPEEQRAAAAEGACFAGEALVKKHGRLVEGKPLTPSKQRLPLNEDDELFLTAVDKLVELAPANENTPSFELRAAELLLELGHKPQAVERLKLLQSRWPTSSAGREAATWLRRLKS